MDLIAFFIFEKDLIVKRMTQKSGGLPRPMLHIRIWGVSDDDLIPNRGFSVEKMVIVQRGGDIFFRCDDFAN